MDASEKPLPSLVGLVKSWIPWWSETTNVSKDFWMPDQSCRVCYECDSQFTLFNRRHHCRLCGRIFCAKCTSNWIPIPSTEQNILHEDLERIRVCNYCYKQWKQGLTTSVDNGNQVSNVNLSTSPSAASLISTKSSDTASSSCSTGESISHSVSSYHKHNSYRSAMTEITVDNRVAVASVRSNDGITEMRGQSSKPWGFCMSRSDEDDDYKHYSQDSSGCHFSQDKCYSDQALFCEVVSNYGSNKLHPDGETSDSRSMGSSLDTNIDWQGSDLIQQVVKKEDENDLVEDCQDCSSLYVAKDVDLGPVDFENNGLLWLPPEPEDEEDEREALLLGDDDDEGGNATGEWGYLHASSNFGGGELRNRDKTNEEHNKAMKSVVDGHFRALVAELMLVENLPVVEEDNNESWLEIITSLSWDAATFLKPDMSINAGMDPGGYVKVKCIASGHPLDSVVVKGVVCKKNVAHRRMKSRIKNPRLLILEGALEYQRVSNLLSSFDTLLLQEMDHLKMAVAKIDAHHPDVVLVEKSVSRYAQDYLLAKGISLVLNIKRSHLECISRCTGSQIVPSIDHISPQKLGYCDMFHVERISEEHGTDGPGGKTLIKTLMYFEGCAKPLGCTILLRGADKDELKKVKNVIQYGIFAAYHLAVETSFLADEGASLPEFPLNSPLTVAIPDKSSTIDRSISTVPGFSVSVSEKIQGPDPCREPHRSNIVPTSDLVSVTDDVPEHIKKTTLLPRFAHERTCPSSAVSDSDYNEVFPKYNASEICSMDSKEPTIQTNREHNQDIMVNNLDANGKQSVASEEVMPDNSRKNYDVADAGEDVIYDNSRSNYDVIEVDKNSSVMPSLQLDEKSIHDQQNSIKEEFPPSPSDHQSILVSLSSRCVWKGTVCERPHLLRIKYYGSSDKPLGRFLRDHLFDHSYRCHSCDMPSEAHVHCYTHRQGTLTISAKKLPEFLLPGEKEGKIWMWHRCLRCPRFNGFPPATRRIVMSDAAWGLSFGKFLELSFSNHAAASRAASCGHSLHRDCLRFYGFGKMVACFRYASIDVHSVYLPPYQLDFNFENQEWIKKELNEVLLRAELLFSEVLIGLDQMVAKRCNTEHLKNCLKTSESCHQIEELREMLQKEKVEFEETAQRILNMEPKKGLQSIDILEINRLRRQLLFQSYMWDNRLVYANSLERNSILVDLGGLGASNIKKTVLVDEKLIDTHVPPISGAVLSENGFVGMDTILHDSQGIETGSDNLHEVSDTVVGLNNKKDCQDISSDGSDITLNRDPSESNVAVRRALSDGEVPVMTSLSDTLDAVWTGNKVQTGIRIPRNNSCALSESALTEKSDLADYREEQSGPSVILSPPKSTTKSSENMEDSVSWLGMPFLNFYRSLNKNFSGSIKKLDTLGEYNPMYVSPFRQSELRCGARLLLPVGCNDTVIPVYDDEPTSIIAYALASPDYRAQFDESERPNDGGESTLPSRSLDRFQSFNEVAMDFSRSIGSLDEGILSMSGSRSLGLDPLTYSHAKISFADNGPFGQTNYTVTCYYAKQFETLRKICCPSEMDFISSLSRCKTWGAQGGKSNVFFAKTLDDRFIIKQVTKTELECFLKFAPGYFNYLCHSIGMQSPTCLAKIFGIYQVKYLKGGKESRMDLLVMENLLFGRNVTRIYDLKGSSRSRYNPDSSGSNKVLLDQNLIESMSTSPIFVGNKAKRLLERAVWNDTSFLASIDAMDYSLLVGVDGEKHELVLGIIDFMRQYTWDKHLETWVKASGILGGPKNTAPTVISPKQYKRRFRKAMTTYFLMIPDQWSPPPNIPSKYQNEPCEEDSSC